MTHDEFKKRMQKLFAEHEALIGRPNRIAEGGNGVFDRYKYPVLTGEHAPVFWRYDLNYETNPHLMERLGINSAFNPGAIELDGRIFLVARVEGFDRKSFFAVAESPSGIDRFRFWDYPVVLPETDDPDINVYDIRLVRHEDGWIYGLFCTERQDPAAPRGDLSSAVAQCGIARTKDLKTWQRLDDLKTQSPQQRNVVLHPEFVQVESGGEGVPPSNRGRDARDTKERGQDARDTGGRGQSLSPTGAGDARDTTCGKYAFYTRPQDGFIQTGSGGGIGWGLADDIEHAVLGPETIVQDRKYHTINEVKNGLGPAPIKTPEGWLQLAHGVRNTAAGLRYVLYAFMTARDDPSRVIYEPGGYLLAPQGEERVGDVSNVAFSNGWVARADGTLLLYYASSDTRSHVATTTVEKLIDYCKHTPRDPLRSAACVQQRIELIQHNLQLPSGS